MLTGLGYRRMRRAASMERKTQVFSIYCEKQNIHNLEEMLRIPFIYHIKQYRLQKLHFALLCYKWIQLGAGVTTQ